ncbi:DUF222 domain-containing protein [Actinomadura sp. 9N407]|uniref:HNH endonuclease signature motif containing protein n=1 Tax=Actinomadura sp. 9N407 TaxID=3375154 RepID=UPI0037A77D40
MAAFLSDTDRLCDLDDSELIEMMAAARRQTAWAQARELAAIAELTARRHIEDEREPDHRVLSAGESLIEEIAAALTVTGNAAATLMHTAERLAHALPGTRTALEQGRIDLLKARVICDATDGMPDHTSTRIETALLEHAAERTTGQLRRRAKSLARRLAPDLCDELADKAGRKRRVEVWDNATGTAALALLDITADDAHAIHAKITAAASAMRTDGDPRPLDQLRADLATLLLRGHPLPDAITALITTAPCDVSGTARADAPPSPAHHATHHQRRQYGDDLDRAGDRIPERTASAIIVDAQAQPEPGTGNGRRAWQECHVITGPISSTQTRQGRFILRLGPPRPQRPRPRRPGDRQRSDQQPPLTLQAPATPRPSFAEERPALTRPAPPAPRPSGAEKQAPLAENQSGGTAGTPLSIAPRAGDDDERHVVEGASPQQHLLRTLANDAELRLSALRARLRATGQLADLPELASQAVRDLHRSLVPYRDSWCDTDEAGRHGHPGYRPPAALRRMIEARHSSCVFPTCNRRVQHCDLDHTIAYDAHGPTCGCNLAPLCRRHHRTKQTPGWWLFQP